jgi:hypothetical protein
MTLHSKGGREMSKEVKLFVGVMLILFLVPAVASARSHFGIPDKATFYPKEFDTTEAAVKRAGASQNAKWCPDKLARAKELGKEGVSLYWACRTEEALKLLAEARDLAMEVENCPPPDSDGDGVPDFRDECPNTPRGVKVDAVGCPIDTDGDGVPDYLDKCPRTPKGVKVDAEGCPLDTDGDGVPDYLDKCPRTPRGVEVDKRGCWIITDVLFDFGKSVVKRAAYPTLDEVAAILKANPYVRIELQGHTDNVGSPGYNKRLSERRAMSVLRALVKRGIEKGRLIAVGFGLTRPIASNATEEGRAYNRRVELHAIK